MPVPVPAPPTPAAQVGSSSSNFDDIRYQFRQRAQAALDALLPPEVPDGEGPKPVKVEIFVHAGHAKVALAEAEGRRRGLEFNAKRVQFLEERLDFCAGIDERLAEANE